MNAGMFCGAQNAIRLDADRTKKIGQQHKEPTKLIDGAGLKHESFNSKVLRKSVKKYLC